MSLEVQRPSGVTVFDELTFDELTFDNKIHRGNVKRSTHRLLRGELGTRIGDWGRELGTVLRYAITAV